MVTVAAVAATLLVLLSGCATGSDAAEEVETPTATVVLGNITIDIASAGNLSYSRQEDLAFDIAGTVEEVMVEVGDSVTEGQVLATLDNDEWEDQVADVQLNLLQAEISYKNAVTALDEAENPYTEEEIADAEQAIKDAKSDYSLALSNLYYALAHSSNNAVDQAQALAYNAERTLEDAEDKLDEMLYERDEDDIEIKSMQLQIAEAQLDDATEAVDDALASSPEIIAPFNGFITTINVSGGDEVLKGTVAVQIADPTRFEAELVVSEMDVFDLSLGSEATVQIDALSDLELPATVTYISPTATISSGVVNYGVTVELDSLDEVRAQQAAEMQAMQEEMQARQEEMAQTLAAGELPEQLQAAVDAGQMTEEEAAQMAEQMKQMAGNAPDMTEMTTTIPDDFELREGLSVTVNIAIDQATDVLLVPNGAINYRGGATYVQVVTADGVTEDRDVTTGISDWQYTEITDGLSEGETVVVNETTVTQSSTSEQGFQRPGGGMMIMPGGGPP